MDAYKPQGTHRNSALLIEERQRAACVLTLNRPSARNSLSLDLIGALRDAIDRAGAMTGVAALIITGAHGAGRQPRC